MVGFGPKMFTSLFSRQHPGGCSCKAKWLTTLNVGVLGSGSVLRNVYIMLHRGLRASQEPCFAGVVEVASSEADATAAVLALAAPAA